MVGIFAIIASSLHPLLLAEHAAYGLVEARLNKNERFTVVCSRCRLNLKFGNFTLSFGRLRQRIELKCVPV